MLKKLTHIQFILSFCYLAAPAAALAVAAGIYDLAGLVTFSQLNLFSYAGLLILQTLAWSAAIEHYHINRVYNLHQGQFKVIKAAVIATFIVLSILFFVRFESFSRLLVGTSAWLTLCFTVGLNLIFSRFVDWYAFFGRPKIGIIGADPFATDIGERLAKQALVRPEIAFYTSLGEQEKGDAKSPLMELADIPRAVRQFQISELLIALSPSHYEKLPEILQRLKGLSIPSRLSLDTGHPAYVANEVFNIGDVAVVSIEPMQIEGAGYMIAKRCFDIAFSSLALLVAAPLMIVIAILIKATSKGPAFFKQQRVGENGEIFYMYKFRSMRVAAEDETDTVWTVAGDHRRTWVGAWLRRSSLDELPQFINVFNGDMSVVGPRPERPYFVQQFEKEIESYSKRHAGKVGITGWAQVHGLRGDTCIRTRVRYDVYYLQNWSFLLDMRIIALTFLRGLIHINAY